MTQIFARLRQMITYNQTVKALRALSLHTRLDLDIAGIESKVARRAVYGF
ncbi:glyceraldehyde-3-phosphate dehydrogenase [Puniceibacterium confluentis]|nr:glyceraldehyde-3-phosphate dehydrogenase [Puniceibacterium confluentis]